jgi:hypothetical protein
MRIRPIIYGFLVLTVFLGVIYGFQAAGIWSVSGKVSSTGRDIQPMDSDTSSIKGWMTLGQITSTYNVSLEEIIQTFNLPPDTTLDTELRSLESDTFSVNDLRLWLQSRTPSEESVPTPTPTIAPTPTELPESIDEQIEEERKVSGVTTFQDLLDWGLTPETIETVIATAIPEDTSLQIRDYLSGTGVRFSEIKLKLQAELDKIPDS